MTPTENLNEVATRLNDPHGRGGKTRLARLLKWDYSTLWRKLNGKSATTHADITAAKAAAAKANRKRSGAR
ncbi:hypothetical protein TA3x_000498 [Tundrisphaera sp. TA3]|uniref:hypothetical protein n=1 Tax=Tundrisphaera sp. TA3 TaxID=3435775 RepID=UPI003EBE03A3